MKRLFFILLFFGVLLLCACGREYGILDYQSKDISAECLINGEYRVKIEKKGDSCHVELKEPRTAEGISFDITKDGVIARAGNVEITIERQHLSGICAIGSIFSQSEECLSSAVQEGGGSVLTFQNEGCTYKITMGEHSVPKRVCIFSESFEYDIEICSIELN